MLSPEPRTLPNLAIAEYAGLARESKSRIGAVGRDSEPYPLPGRGSAHRAINHDGTCPTGPNAATVQLARSTVIWGEVGLAEYISENGATLAVDLFPVETDGWHIFA